MSGTRKGGAGAGPNPGCCCPWSPSHVGPHPLPTPRLSRRGRISQKLISLKQEIGDRSQGERGQRAGGGSQGPGGGCQVTPTLQPMSPSLLPWFTHPKPVTRPARQTGTQQEWEGDGLSSSLRHPGMSRGATRPTREHQLTRRWSVRRASPAAIPDSSAAIGPARRLAPGRRVAPGQPWTLAQGT